MHLLVEVRKKQLLTKSERMNDRWKQKQLPVYNYESNKRRRRPQRYDRYLLLYDILEWLRNGTSNRSNSAFPLFIMTCLLVPSRYLFSTYAGYAYSLSPLINGRSIKAQHGTRTVSWNNGNLCWSRYSLYTKRGVHYEGNKKLSLVLAANVMGDHFKYMRIGNTTEKEVTEIIPMIRQCISISQLHDIMNLYRQPGTLSTSSTLIAEITQRFAHLLIVRYGNKNTNATSIDSQKFGSIGSHNDIGEGEILSEVLSLVTSMYYQGYRDTQPKQTLIDAVNCFVGLTNTLQTYLIQYAINSKQQNAIIPVINQLWNLIIDHEHGVDYDSGQSIIYNMPPKMLVSFLVSIHKLNQYTDENSPDIIHHMDASSLVYVNTCARLCHGDRINRLNLHDIYQVLKSSIASPSSPWHVCNNPVAQQLLISLVRRVRKPIVYNETETISTIVQALDQMQRLWYSINSTLLNITNESFVTSRSDDPRISSLSREIELSMYRLVCHVINTSVPNAMNHSHTTTFKQLSIKEVGILAVTMRIVLPRKRVALETNTRSRNPSLVLHYQRLVTTQVSMIKLNPISKGSTQRAKITTIRDISRILSTCEYCQYPDVKIHRPSEGTDLNQATHEMIQTLGDLTKQIVAEGTDNVDIVIKPSDFNDILRTLAFLPDSYSKQSYCSALQHLIVHNDEFLRECSVTELSNFCWFMAFKSNHYFYTITNAKDAVITALGNRIVQPDTCQTCNPKQACRILSAFTAICCDPMTDRSSVICKFDHEQSNVLSNLFQCLGECLLESSALSPHDASSAIYAYAKAQYVYDLGIFDHLVNSFAEHVQGKPLSCTLRQICQTLWACGKMVSVESSSNDMDVAALDPTENIYPPYYKSVITMISHVISKADELSVQDITQTLWAMSHFNLLAHDSFDGDEENVEINIEPLLLRVLTLTTAFNTYERATLLWSFSRTPVLSPMLARIIFLITRPFAQPCNTEQHIAIDEPQAASIILYSLGRLNIRDIEVFRYLTNYVLEYQIKAASAQTIANILWAHRSVHIEPPQQLLESWAMLKLPDLNIVGFSDRGMAPYTILPTEM